MLIAVLEQKKAKFLIRYPQSAIRNPQVIEVLEHFNYLTPHFLSVVTGKLK